MKKMNTKKGGANNNNLIISPFETNLESIRTNNQSNYKKKNKLVKTLKKSYQFQNNKLNNLTNTRKLIGQGTYGCVYKPPLKCLNPTDCPDNNNKCKTGISKLMGDKESVDEELKMYTNTRIDDINSSSLYHIKEPRRCKPSMNNVEKAKSDGCQVELKEPELLIYENGGMDLEKAIENNISPYSIVFNFTNIFKAVLTLYANDIGHCDIKLGNIVIGVNQSNPQYRLIDLGLSRKFDKSLTKNDIFMQPYFAWPPDSIYLYKENFNEYDLNKQIKKFMKSSKILGIMDTYYKKRGWWDEKVLIQMIKLSNLSPDNSLIKNKKQQYSLVSRSFDMYGVGVCINDMVEMFSKYIKDPSKYYTKNPEYHQEAKIAIKLLTTFLDESNILHPSAIFRPNPELSYQLYKNYVIFPLSNPITPSQMPSENEN